MDSDLKKNIISALKKYYPLPIIFKDIKNLSHFRIQNINNYSKFLPFHINIDGLILSGEYKNYKIIFIITSTGKKLDWGKFILLYIFLVHSQIDKNKFIYLLHTYNKILILKTLIIKKNNNIIEYNITYTKNLPYNITYEKPTYAKPTYAKPNNHFYLNSFSVNNNHKQLKNEIDRLIKNRDKYNSIYFHLDNNGGGDIVPAHLILRCLIGKKEPWMKNIKKILTNKEIYEWDCWKEETPNGPNYEVVKKLNLDKLPNYDTKYSGKIYIHMDKYNNYSSAWFFITYLIYAFSKKIHRFSKSIYGENIKYGTIKYGTIESDQLKLYGHSGTTSGDGNSIIIKYKKNIIIRVPTEQFISCSIKKIDWNRFWIE